MYEPARLSACPIDERGKGEDLNGGNMLGIICTISSSHIADVISIGYILDELLAL